GSLQLDRLERCSASQAEAVFHAPVSHADHERARRLLRRNTGRGLAPRATAYPRCGGLRVESSKGRSSRSVVMGIRADRAVFGAVIALGFPEMSRPGYQPAPPCSAG